ncbi:MAG: pyrroloquinoline quinone-dependent dehydrogenase [Vicinamibacterales bacterium]
MQALQSTRRALLPLLLAAALPYALHAQVTPDRLVRAADEPRNWLTYSGTYSGQRHSPLKQIDATNVKNLEIKWIFQANSLQSFSATPLVVDGIMYVTQAPNDVVAIDAATGRVFWIYHYAAEPGRLCCRGQVNRGLGILGDSLFMATVDAHLLAIDAKNGKPLWKTKVGDASNAYGMTLAPLVVKDKVIVGVAGAEFGIRGYIAAYEAATGKEAWRFYTIPGPGEPGHETWKGDAWKHGGGSVWTTGTYDPELNLTYWGIGNPGPDFNAEQRPGDNLYSDSVVALDSDTGKLKWHFQFTPNDPYDYDSTQVPVLVDGMWRGSPRKLMYFANRNGFFYVLDRATGEFLQGKAYVNVNWARGLDAKGRPQLTPQSKGETTYPGPLGATNWYSPSFNPNTGLFYLSAWENYGQIFDPGDPIEFREGQNFTGGRLAPPPGAPQMPGMQRGPVNTWHEGAAHGVIMAIDPVTATKKWGYPMHDVTTSGVLTTASDLLFVGGREGYFHALDARTGSLLWRMNVGGETAAGPMSFMVGGKQMVAVAAGHSLFVFGLR